MKELKESEIATMAKVPEDTVGWLDLRLPEEVMSRLQNYIEVAKKNPDGKPLSLAGNISKSLSLEDRDTWFFNTILAPLINVYSQAFPYYMDSSFGIGDILTEDAPYCLESFWVNFQKENEFNPMHNHTGVFSFVVWVKIPTNWREQHALPFVAKSNTPNASDFEFNYTTMLGQIGQTTYLLDKESEGQILFFPAKLMHGVYPFYNCDKERISISGNINFDISENSMRKLRFQQQKSKTERKGGGGSSMNKKKRIEKDVFQNG